MANVHIRFNDDIETYEPSDSENEYTEKEKTLLKKHRKRKPSYSDSEEEVYNLNQNESSDENENADSDIDKVDDDDLPDVRAWGKRIKDFYSTDYVDQDYGGYQGKDATEADFEEDEAKEIQKRLAEQLDDEDFSLDIFSNKTVERVVENSEIIKSDKSNLSKRELSQLIQNESPEMFVLIEDYKAKMNVVKSYLHPMIQKHKNGSLPETEAINFLETFYHLILNYCSNISMYLLLKASKVNINIHPVLKRLYQYRKLISQLENIYNEIIQPQIEIILNENDVKSIKRLKTLSKFDAVVENSDTEEKQSVKSESIQSESNIDEKTMEVDEDDAKRAITYQMQKNKGLLPNRKKEQRNPRVKHRNKFRKAIIRRKGAVREVRKELKRYGGEISGIKASVSKSVKIK